MLLTNPRYAYPDNSKPNGEGAKVWTWDNATHWDVNNAIDGSLSSATHPQYGAYSASFFVDLNQASIVDFVKIWPRLDVDRWVSHLL